MFLILFLLQHISFIITKVIRTGSDNLLVPLLQNPLSPEESSSLTPLYFYTFIKYKIGIPRSLIKSFWNTPHWIISYSDPSLNYLLQRLWNTPHWIISYSDPSLNYLLQWPLTELSLTVTPHWIISYSDSFPWFDILRFLLGFGICCHS